MTQSSLNADICIIGAGSGGLSVAAGAAQLGAKTVLIERDKMGGDCLNTGCVPSKALIAAAHHAYNRSQGDDFGVRAAAPIVDFHKTNMHVKDVIKGIEPHDSQERFEGLGVTVLRDEATFVNPHEVQAGQTRIRARRFVIATGSSATVPPIEGIADVNVYTNENIFENTALPEHLAIIGGGPIGMEMAQAHRRLGAKVTVLEMFAVLSKDDPDLTAIVRQQFEKEDITLHEHTSISHIEAMAGGGRIHFEKEGRSDHVDASHILVAAGRKPNIDALNLDAAGVAFDRHGITVDARLRSSQKHIFAIGDVAGGLQFTHVAGYHAGIVIRNALFRLPAKASIDATPWVTYTDPELANVGLLEAHAREKHGDSIRVLRWPFQENDRARAERTTDGLAKVITSKRGAILGAGIAGPHAGELIQPWVLAMSSRLKIGAMANMIAPYPTLGEVNKRAAGSYYTDSLFSPRTQRLVRFLSKFG